MRWVLGRGVSFYRLVLPAQLVSGRFDQGGTWHALLTIGRPRTKPTEGVEDGVDLSILRGIHAGGRAASRDARAGLLSEQARRFELAQNFDHDLLAAAVAELPRGVPGIAQQRRSLPYSLVVHGYSEIALRADVHQSGWEPGATVRVQATLTQSTIPLEGSASVWAELTRPDGSSTQLVLNLTDPGRYAAEYRADSSGVYRMRVRAHGRTRHGMPFTRERSLTAAVWRGGDRDADGTGGSRPGQGGQETLCRLLRCLLEEGGLVGPELEKRLRDAGLDLGRLRKCVDGACDHEPQRSPRDEG